MINSAVHVARQILISTQLNFIESSVNQLMDIIASEMGGMIKAHSVLFVECIWRSQCSSKIKAGDIESAAFYDSIFYMKYIIGIDEVGRGPLAGPVTLCAVRLEAGVYKKLQESKDLPVPGKDSKKLSKKDREKYATVLKSLMSKGTFDMRFRYVIYSVSNAVIDMRSLSFAIKKALTSCLQKVGATEKNKVLLDGGLKAPKEYINQEMIIKGDEKHPVIAWASILAKVHRDNYMVKMAKKYPLYGFEKHMGYGTKIHREAIKKHGPSPLHRKSFLKNISK